MAGTFGWCIEGNHTDCIKKKQRWYWGKEKKGRKMVEAIIYLDEYNECGCYCHKPRKTAKKTAVKRSTRSKK